MTIPAHQQLRRGLAVLTVLAVLLGLTLAAVWTVAGPAAADEGSDKPAAPAQPAGLRVATQQGSRDVSVAWDEVEKATHYLLRWRSVDNGGKLNEGVEKLSSSAAIKVADYGQWVVWVPACNDAGCGKPLAMAQLGGSPRVK